MTAEAKQHVKICAQMKCSRCVNRWHSDEMFSKHTTGSRPLEQRWPNMQEHSNTIEDTRKWDTCASAPRQQKPSSKENREHVTRVALGTNKTVMDTTPPSPLITHGATLGSKRNQSLQSHRAQPTHTTRRDHPHGRHLKHSVAFNLFIITTNLAIDKLDVVEQFSHQNAPE